jgi:hypothetical protein
VNDTRHLVRTGQEGGKEACRIFRLRPPKRTRKRVGGEDLGVKAVRDPSLPPARLERLKTAAADERHRRFQAPDFTSAAGRIRDSYAAPPDSRDLNPA